MTLVKSATNWFCMSKYTELMFFLSIKSKFYWIRSLIFNSIFNIEKKLLTSINSNQSTIASRIVKQLKSNNKLFKQQQQKLYIFILIVTEIRPFSFCVCLAIISKLTCNYLKMNAFFHSLQKLVIACYLKKKHHCCII